MVESLPTWALVLYAAVAVPLSLTVVALLISQNLRKRKAVGGSSNMDSTGSLS